MAELILKCSHNIKEQNQFDSKYNEANVNSFHHFWEKELILFVREIIRFLGSFF